MLFPPQSARILLLKSRVRQKTGAPEKKGPEKEALFNLDPHEEGGMKCIMILGKKNSRK